MEELEIKDLNQEINPEFAFIIVMLGVFLNMKSKII